MPLYLKIIISFCAEVFLVVTGGMIGVWLVARDTPAGVGGLGDGIGMFLFGAVGMVISGMIGVVGLVVFWSVLAMRSEAAGKNMGGTKPGFPQAEGVWPPPPRR